MLTNEELQISNRSYINKDFQTIYPELISIMKSLTNRFDPDAANESDPMIVLLKLLAFIGDKTNYNIDKNVLEAFLPSATQETSVRTLLETNGYNMKYYQSSRTNISLLYSGELSNNKQIIFKGFDTQFTDVNHSITYTLLNDVILNSPNVTYSDGIITEGVYKDLSINGNLDIQLSNLDDNYRIYFPETMVAENGIFVKNVGSEDWNVKGISGNGWVPVKNLNLYTPKSKNFKFGFDSNKNLPYIQFPDDIIELIGNGLNIRYIITNGVSGNIARGRLTELKNPTIDSLYYYNSNNVATDENVITIDENTNQQLLKIFNYNASNNGSNPEDINQAYSNFKKTIGTFETLVTTRDFANWFYNYIDPETSKPLVNNIQVSDRRIDTTFYRPVISYDDYGVTTVYNTLEFDGGNTIKPFDLVLYPLNTVNTYVSYNQNTGELQSNNYDATFKPNTTVVTELINVVQNSQSIDHTYITVTNEQPYLYKNYYTLNAKVSTVDKVNQIERLIIVNNIKEALFNKFNSRELDYGEEIPFDTLYDTILNADSRIKNVVLAEPEVTTKVMLGNGNEYEFNNGEIGVNYYIDMLARNILAGKVSEWEYDNDYVFDYTMGALTTYDNVISLKPKLELTNPSDYTLTKNQVVQLFGDNYSNGPTATVGVNYYWDSETTIDANTIHQITGSECLYISYTNSNDELRTYKYTSNSIITYNESGVQIETQSIDVNYIKPNFNLEPSGDGKGTIIVKVDGTDMKFYSLGASQTISFPTKNEKVFNSGQYYFYWKLEDTTNKLFDTNVDTIILGENEYLMYTDSSKSNVEVFSSGTKISKNGLFANVEWDINNTIDTSEIIDGDLSTYANIPWKTISFDGSNTLTITQQKILTLVEGDEITYGGAIDNELEPLDSDFSYWINGGGNGTKKSSDLEHWMVRTRLDINCGPDLPQTLTSGESVDMTIQNAQQPTTLTNTTIKSNYLIQRSGNGTIDTELSGTTFNMVGYTEGVLPSGVEQIANNMLRVSFKDLSYSGTPSIATITLNIPIISGETTKTMVYAKFDSDDSAKYIVGDIPEEPQWIDLGSGLTMIDVNASSITFTIGSSITSTGYILIDQPKLIKGINSKFGLDSSQSSSLISKITSLKGNKAFYSTYTIPNPNLIDVEDFKNPSVMWDKNNVLNKFTLAQIDFENSLIDVLKSSLK